MNSDSRNICEEYAKQAGAIAPCPICGNYYINADEPEATSKAYAMVTIGWKNDEFGVSNREEVIHLMESVLAANINCPSCR